MASGFTSNTGWVPVVAKPPACSMMKATGLHSYRSRSCRERVRQVASCPKSQALPLKLEAEFLPLDFRLVSAVGSSPSAERASRDLAPLEGSWVHQLLSRAWAFAGTSAWQLPDL